MRLNIYSGVEIHSTGDNRVEIQRRINVVNRRFFTLRSVFKLRNISQKKQNDTIQYKAMIRSIVLYMQLKHWHQQKIRT